MPNFVFGINQDADSYHIMFDQKTKQRFRIDQFPIASQLINQMMLALLPLLKQHNILTHRLFQIDYLSTLTTRSLSVYIPQNT